MKNSSIQKYMLYTIQMLILLNIVKYFHFKDVQAEVKSKEQAEEPTISTYISEAAKEHGVDRTMLSCLLKIESSYNLKAVSDTGDHGIGQVNPTYWKQFDAVKLTSDLPYSINAAAYVLGYYKWLKGKEEFRQWPCRYNVGPGSLSKMLGYRTRGAVCEQYLQKLNACMAKPSELL